MLKTRVMSRLLFLLLVFVATAAEAQTLKGIVTDRKSHEPLVGVVVEAVGTDLKTVTDENGRFTLETKNKAVNSLIVKYVGYRTQNIDGVQEKLSNGDGVLNIALEADEQQLSGVTVTGIERKNTETAAVQAVKNSSVIVSNVSAQEIAKTQDTNAGEVIRRVPGVSLIDDKFVMVRGLSQRYNNVWINNGAVPSSEADSRAFSFDIIPSSQLDNLTIVKTPSAEYPADYTGGFILIETKEIPLQNAAHIMVGGNWNDASAFRESLQGKTSGTDFLGFDSGLRHLDAGMEGTLNTLSNGGTSLTGNGLCNDWLTRSHHPWGDLKLSADLARRWDLRGYRLGMMAAANYTNEWRTYADMENNLFGVYDAANDRPNYLRQSVDQQYNHNVRVGALLNFTLLSKDGTSKYEFKNIFNQLGNNRYTWRDGVSAQANLERSAEYYYRSRTTYNTQLTGKHTFTSDQLDWNLGYAYANRHLPDRRRYLIDDALESNVFALSTGNDISREWTQLDEHILSASVNDKHDFTFGSWSPSLKFGAYGEYRTRKYLTREFIYAWDASNNTLPDDFAHSDIPTLLSDEANFGADKLYMIEQVQWRNNYRGHNTLGAGYFNATLPFGPLSVQAGLRFEHNDMELISNTRDDQKSETSRHYRGDDLFPSVNATYKIDEKNQVRLAYGRSINRPEFREVSSSVYYDFDLASNVQGNTELKNCYVQNIDLRYEFYPSRGEQISLAAFYKHFSNPIEWTYTVAGGTDLVYSYMNASSANNYGLELDIRKTLDFIGLRNFSWSFNGALIHSRVKFDSDAHQENRPMQGQSPYLINTGIFYRNETLGLQCALLYNRIGKRIIGVGRSEGTTGSDENARVPDSYEMPRNVFDLTASYKLGKHWEAKLYLRDILSEKVYYKQFADVTYSDGHTAKITEVTRSYRPGRNWGLQVIYAF